MNTWHARNCRRNAAVCAALLGCLFFLAAGSGVAKDPSGASSQGRYRVVGYLASWSTFLPIHPEKLTHINVAFAHIGRDGRVTLADSGMEEKLERLKVLKERNPQLKIIMSVGGWEADGFSDAALTNTSRVAFADSAITLVRRYSLDGLDIDWEYPGQGVASIKYRAEDKHNFTLLLETLRDTLDRANAADNRIRDSRYSLSIASADREYFKHTEMGLLHSYLDWINVMSYDFFNSLTPTTGHHAGLYKSAGALPADRDADSSIKQHLEAGIPPEKIVLGVAFYGRGFAEVKPLNRGLNQPYGRFEAAHDYTDLASTFIGKDGFARYWDDQAKSPYLWNPTSRIFITYDDPISIRIKADYVKAHHLGGMMFWELSEDRDEELLDVVVRSLR